MKHSTKIYLSLFFLLSFNMVKAQDVTKQDTSHIIYLERVNSVDDLFGKFRGNIVYVDFWASWCGSCLAEFKSEPDLDAFLKSNKIVRLYIALEKPVNDSAIQLKNIDKWEKLINKYNLAGYHYYGLLYSDFMHSVTEKIMKGKLSLPRFSIIDKNGVIVDRDAKRPSNVDGLIKELTKYVNKN